MNDHDNRSQYPCSDEDRWGAVARLLAGGKLSVIMPMYNLGISTGKNVREVYDLLAGRIPFELIPVDDGSADETGRELGLLSTQLPEVKPVILAKNHGKGIALKHGFEASTGSHVLLLDGDLDLPPAQFTRLFETMEREEADVVIGSKRHPDSVLDYPKRRRIPSAIYYFIVKLLIGLPVRDTQTGIKLFKREALAYAMQRILVREYAFDLELLAIIHEKGFRISEAPVELTFHGRWGAFRPSVVRSIIFDTLAVLYRLRLLRYYRTICETVMPQPAPLVSIVIACPAPSAYLDECIDGILKQTYRDYEVILLPDQPSERQWPPGFREVPTGPVRPAEKRNIGIREACGEIVAFIDDDAAPTENWLQQAIPCFGDEITAAVGGPSTTPGNDAYMAKLGGLVYANPFVSGTYRYRYVHDRVREVEDYPSCNLFVRTAVLRQLGGFRTDFWPGEDTYLCLEIVKRLRQKIVYDPRVHVFHHRRKLFLPHLRQIGRYALHRGFFAKRFPETSRKLSYAIPSLFVIALVLGAVVSAFCPVCRTIFLASLAVYGSLILLSCFRMNLATWILTWLGVVLTHVTYGTYFIAGLLSRRMPGEPEKFDHPSEANDSQ